MKKIFKRRKKRQNKNIARRIIFDFLEFNGVSLLTLVAIYLIVYLFLLLEPDLYIDVIKPLLISLFGKSGESFLFSRSYLVGLAAFLCLFVYPLTFTIDTPPCMIQRNMLYYALSRGEKGMRGANTYPTDRKGVKK